MYDAKLFQPSGCLLFSMDGILFLLFCKVLLSVAILSTGQTGCHS